MALLALIGWFIFITISSVVLYLLYNNWRIQRQCQKKGIPFLGTGMSRLIPFALGYRSIAELEKQLYSLASETGKPFVCLNDAFTNKAFYIQDLALLRSIYIKDFEHFGNRRKVATNEKDILQQMLLSLEGDNWKHLRSKLSPAFTTGKIRRMFQIFDRSSQRLCDYFRDCVGDGGGDIDICDAFSKYAMDVIASCAFAIESKAFERKQGESSQFEKMGHRLQFNFDIKIFFNMLLLLIAPKIAGFFGIKSFATESREYFSGIVKAAMKHRRETGQKQDDFLQLMLDAQEGLLKSEETSKEALEVMTGSKEGIKSNFSLEETSKKYSFSDDAIVANCVLFLIAGFDTTKALLNFTTYQLAKEQECQERLYNEVRSAFEKNGGSLPYEEVLHMQYLDMFINETLRLLSPATRTERSCTKDYKVPGMDFVIEKGNVLIIPILGVHHDPKYFPNPEIFDPERFLPERKNTQYPYAFAPFGHGPRNCIGMRFALTEVKAMLATLVYNFKLEQCSKTDKEIKFAQSLIMKPADGIWLRLKSRRKLS